MQDFILFIIFLTIWIFFSSSLCLEAVIVGECGTVAEHDLIGDFRLSVFDVDACSAVVVSEVVTCFISELFVSILFWSPSFILRFIVILERGRTILVPKMLNVNVHHFG